MEGIVWFEVSLMRKCDLGTSVANIVGTIAWRDIMGQRGRRIGYMKWATE